MKQKLVRFINDGFYPALCSALEKEFGITETSTYFDIFSSKIKFEFKSQGIKKDREIEDFLRVFEIGYLSAMEVGNKFGL